MSSVRKWLFLSLVVGAAACGGGGDGASGEAPAQPYTDFFTSVTGESLYPRSSPYSVEKEALGEALFWDPILSGDRNVACASCHHPDLAWADGRDLSIGVDGVGLGAEREGVETTEFHSPTVANVAFSGLELDMSEEDFESGPYFWDLRADTLAEQALEPIKSDVEMRGFAIDEQDILDIVVARLEDNDEYRAMFEAAFGVEDPITSDNIAAALATFQRRIVTQPTRFDDFLDGDESALTGREIMGLNKFINGGCARCHSGSMLSDFTIHVTQPVLRGAEAVRTPSLRNVELTAPYMHDGSQRTLRDAIALYEERGDLAVTLEDEDFGDIEAFLRTLTDTDFYQAIPDRVPSELPVGGDIHP